MSSGSISPFQPHLTVSISASTTSGSVPISGHGDGILVTNSTTSIAYVRFGSDATLQASTGDTPLLAGSHILLRCGPFVSYCAVVLGSGSGLVMFTRGDGSFI